MTPEEFELQRQQAVQNALSSISSGNDDELKLKAGNNHVRILPRMNADGTRNFQFWNTISVHWSVGVQNRAIACGRQFGESCVICEQIQQLRNAGNVEQADQMKAKDTHLVGVQPAEDPTSTRYIRCAPTVMEGILKYANDPNWGCPSDPEKGYSINISKSGQGQKNTKYQVQAAPNKGPIDPALLQKLPDLEAAFPRMTREQVQAILYGTSQQTASSPQGSVLADTASPVLASANATVPGAPPPPVLSSTPAVAQFQPVSQTPPPPPSAIPSAPAPPPPVAQAAVGVTGAENVTMVAEAPPFKVPPQ